MIAPQSQSKIASFVVGEFPRVSLDTLLVKSRCRMNAPENK